MHKERMRNEMIQKLKKIGKVERTAIEQKLHTHLFTSNLWKHSKVIGITYAMNFEWNTCVIIKEAWKDNKEVVLPKSDMNHKQMEFYRIDSFNMLQSGYKGILEPLACAEQYVSKKNIDLLIVPGIVFDKSGYRIGFGGGFYDRYLIKYPNKTISLLSERQLVSKLKNEQHDIPVQHLITENGFVE